MEISRNQVFNLWDTNGRRHDVINAIEIYLGILQYLYTQYPNEHWGTYPNSTMQYLFYKAAIEASPDVFQSHQNFDDFELFLEDKYESFFSKTLQLDRQVSDNLDANIEQRARHYTSNLVRLGFVDKDRTISMAGKELLDGAIVRDKLEELLPVTDTNLAIFRQLLKLRIYTEPNPDGTRFFYSPCLYALYLLLNNDNVDINYFKHQIQGASPYWQEKIDLEKNQNLDLFQFVYDDIVIPQLFLSTSKISSLEFSTCIKNRKSNSTIPIYYTFYSSLFDYVENPNDANYIKLRNILLGRDSAKLKKAFGFGVDVFNCGNTARPYSHEQFIEENIGNPLLTSNINQEFYKNYSISKYLDTAREYSDTTIRMLGATGLFQFSKPLVELAYKDYFQILMSHINIKQSIFGVVNQQQYNKREQDIQSDFYRATPLSEIFEFNNQIIEEILSGLQSSYGDTTDIRSVLIKENRIKLDNHIQEKYPKETVVELLRLISNRQNDKTIKQYVNEDATVPTIYEYLVAIAWYYISNMTISVYDSLNLTLNGDLEPVIHAGGGIGDIVVKYEDKIVMLEATLMNAAAQKRGEWEPVLRHAINLTAESFPKKVFTLFVADELDYNTINIWRAVAAVTLESSSTGEKTEHVVIMPFTNEHLCYFIEHNVDDERIISAINRSYDEIKTSFDDTWHERIIASL